MSETFYAVTEGMKGFGHRGVFGDSEGHRSEYHVPRCLRHHMSVFETSTAPTDQRLSCASARLRTLYSAARKSEESTHGGEESPARWKYCVNDSCPGSPFGQNIDELSLRYVLSHDDGRQLHDPDIPQRRESQGGHVLADETRSVWNPGGCAIRSLKGPFVF
jgi:hypothetical protein